MIDYLPFEQTAYKGGLTGLKELGLNMKEVKTKRSSFYFAKLLNMEIRYFPNTELLKISGSPHFYFNDGFHNRNDFNRIDLYNTLIDICTRTGVNASVATMHGPEFGVNVEVVLSARTIVNRILNKGHVTIEPTEGGYYLGNKSGHARLKIYNKNRSEEPTKHFLRVEIHVNKMAWFESRKIDISTVDCLFKTETLKRLGEILIEELAEVNFIEEVNRNLITKKRDLEFYDLVTVRSAWEGLTKMKRKRQLARYRKIVSTYSGGVSLSDYLCELVSTKWNELMLVLPPLKKCYHSTEWETSDTKPESVTILPLDIDGRKVTLKKERVRGKFQKLDTAGKSGNVPVFNIRKCSNCRAWMEESKRYCSDKCKQQHDTRNQRTNPPHKLKRRLEQTATTGGGLFNPLDTVKLTTGQCKELAYFDDKNDSFMSKNRRILTNL